MSETFAGFGDQALPFFKALAFHQTKEWFEENRSVYETHVREPFAALVADVSAGLASAGVELRGDPKKSVFRLNRDIRFSKDKSPYKTHTGAVLTRSGAKNDIGLLYVHIDPQGCFLAAGHYHPEPADLKRLRTALVERPATYRKVAKHLSAHRLVLKDDEALTRLPRDFADVTDPDLVEALKFKSFVVRAPFPDSELKSRKLVARLVRLGIVADPLIAWCRGEDVEPALARAKDAARA